MKKYYHSLGLLTLLFSVGFSGAEVSASSHKNDGTINYDGEYDREVIDPEEPGDIVDPGESPKVGDKLRIDFVPNLRFGEHKITKEETSFQVYAQNYHSDTPTRATHIQVSDFRGSNGKGWQLYLKQEHQFRSISDQNVELLGASLYFDQSWVSSTYDSPAPQVQTDIITVNPEQSYIVANAKTGAGEGTWAISFGASSNDITNVKNTLQKTDLTDELYGNKPVYLNSAVGLTVPNTANVRSATYQTVLTWTLSELP